MGDAASTDEGFHHAGRYLVSRAVGSVGSKAGVRGACLITPEACIPEPGFAVKIVGTVTAGASFNAGLATALSATRWGACLGSSG